MIQPAIRTYTYLIFILSTPEYVGRDQNFSTYKFSIVSKFYYVSLSVAQANAEDLTISISTNKSSIKKTLAVNRDAL